LLNHKKNLAKKRSQ